MKYLIGIALIAAGIFFVVKTSLMIQWFGRIAWAEQKLGSGGTWSFYKIFGIIIIFLAFMIMSGDVKVGAEAQESLFAPVVE